MRRDGGEFGGAPPMAGTLIISDGMLLFPPLPPLKFTKELIKASQVKYCTLYYLFNRTQDSISGVA